MAQVFMIVVKVTVNTLEPVSGVDVQNEIDDCIGEFGGGTAEVMSIVEEQ